MPILNRDLVTDRPTLIDPIVGVEDDEDEQESRNSDRESSRSERRDRRRRNRVEVRGEGGGPVVNGVEFEEGQEDIIKSSNLITVMATGEEEGEVFNEIFKNASYHLKEIKKQGHDITDLTTLSERIEVADIGAEDVFDGDDEGGDDEEDGDGIDKEEEIEEESDEDGETAEE